MLGGEFRKNISWAMPLAVGVKAKLIWILKGSTALFEMAGRWGVGKAQMAWRRGPMSRQDRREGQR